MKTTFFLTGGVLAAVFALGAPKSWDRPQDWVEQAVSSDSSVAQKAQAHLREAGPRGLQSLEQRFVNETQRVGLDPRPGRRIREALDRVGAQYDNYATGLYWYTDFEKAKAAARTSGRPILSLRLLGRLDEALSCANSRFFRTTLYPAPVVNRLLKDRFILHWESVRSVPKVTVDFGNGRTLERTITGNSIHYVLNPDGDVVDALPGLYSASVFAAELIRAADAVKGSRQSHLQATQKRLLGAWAADLSKLRVAMRAGLALTGADLEQLTDENRWQQLAQLHAHEAVFTQTAALSMGQEFPDAQAAAPLAVTKMAIERPLLRAMSNLTRTAALDTVRNNYLLRTKILAVLARPDNGLPSLIAINRWVYAQVFLTPLNDPWLGLAPPDVFAAIDRSGETR